LAVSLVSAVGAQAAASRPQLPLGLAIGLALLAAIAILAVLAPWIAPFDYDRMAPRLRLHAPDLIHWLGTDELGRDVLSRVLYGSRLSLLLGFAATAVGLAIGVPIGLVAGFLRGWVDEGLMRLLDLVMAFPPLMLMLLILTTTTPALWKAAVTVGVLSAPAIARVARSVTLGIAAEEFVTAARARGESTFYVLFCEILPNAWPAIIIEGALRITFAILAGAALSFLGFGVQPPAADWGLMISQARSFLAVAPWIALAPGAAMCVTVIAVNLMGDGLRQRLDPRARQ
jgi:peptide/nickel transport system permease protein